MKYIFFLALTLLLPAISYAAPTNLTFHSLPGLNDAASFTTENYINALYVLAISLAAILAVIKLIMAGTQYMLTDIVTKKQNAKDNIKGALLGLVIILVAVTILNTINPNLTNLNILRNAEPLTPVPGSSGVTPDYDPDAPRSGDLIRRESGGSSGRMSWILDEFGSMDEFNNWCSGQGGATREEEVISGIVYSCRHP